MVMAKTRKAITRAAALCGFGLLLQTGLMAQEAATPPEQPEPASSENTESEPAEPVTPAQVEAASDDPFDYEATEQISEDLSVSFPVDI